MGRLKGTTAPADSAMASKQARAKKIPWAFTQFLGGLQPSFWVMFAKGLCPNAAVSLTSSIPECLNAAVGDVERRQVHKVPKPLWQRRQAVA
jgi:hypothetical protein